MTKSVAVFFLFLLLFALAAPVSASSTEGYAYSITLTIDGSLITEDVENFPALIRLSDTMGTNGFDGSIVFDEIGESYLKLCVYFQASPLNIELEYWNATEELGVLWVCIPLLVAGYDAKLTLAYDGAHTNNTEHIGLIGSAIGQSVWSSDFVIVNHLTDSDSSHVLDSTINKNDGTKKASNEPLETIGKIGYGQNGDGVNDYITISADASFQNFDEFTLTFWMNATLFDASYRYILDKNWNYGGAFLVSVDPTGNPIKKIGIWVRDTGSRYTGLEFSDLNTWYFVCCQFKKGERIRMSYNGGAFHYGDMTDNTTLSLLANLRIFQSSNDFAGCLDELRLNSVADNQAYVLLEYYSQSEQLFEISTAITDTDFILAFAIIAFIIAVVAVALVLSR